MSYVLIFPIQMPLEPFICVVETREWAQNMRIEFLSYLRFT